MQTDGADVIIVGAGVIGCAIAYFLSKEGLKVVVVEQDSLGDHASGFAPGIVNSMPLAAKEVLRPMGQKSFQMHKVLYQQLKEETGLDYYFRESDASMILAFTEAEADELRFRVDLAQKQGGKLRWLDKDDVRNIESRVSAEVIGAACSEESGIVDSYRFVLALAQAAEKNGVEIRHGQVIGLIRNGTRVTAVKLSSSHDIPCERLILTMGPWAGMASSWLSVPVPVRPQRGQVLRLQASGPPFVSALSRPGYYISLTKQPDGLIYIGTTHEEVGFDDQPTEEGRISIISGVLPMVPSLVEAEIVLHTACLRPLSADELPIIGEVPGWDNVYLATGHWMQGIILSPVTARIITDLIVKGHTSISIEPFAPGRFFTKRGH